METVRHSAVIDALIEHIDSKITELNSLQQTILQVELTNQDRGIRCVRVERSGMSSFTGRTIRMLPEQVLDLAFDITGHQEVTIRVEISMNYLATDGRTSARTVCCGTEIHAESFQAIGAPHQLTQDGWLSVPLGSNHGLLRDCPWLYRGELSDELLVVMYGSEIERFNDECQRVFGNSAVAVKLCMEFLRAKRRVLGFLQ